MTKKEKKALDRKQRCLEPMNLGTRDMKSPKDYDRKKSKRELKKMLDNDED